jgi:flagellar basal-body rod protein FlgG
MNPGLRTSASGMRAQQLMVDTIANNLANVNTTGFKRSRVSFEDVLYETLEQPRTVNPNDSQTIAPVQIGKGVRLGAITRLHTQGAPEQTGRTLDVAIQGDGFFQVEKPDGTTAYTRDGSFGVSDTGAIVTNDGYRVLPNVTLPQDVQDVSISPSGLVQANNGSGQPVELGRIELARFVNPSGLMSLGENLYAETAASGQPVTGFPQELGFGKLMQGYLESSNVEIVQEMTDMIAAQRAYEINAKAIRAGEDMMQATNDLIR